MAIDEALEVMRRRMDRPANGVTWSPREQAERAVLAELDRLRRVEVAARRLILALGEEDEPIPPQTDAAVADLHEAITGLRAPGWRTGD